MSFLSFTPSVNTQAFYANIVDGMVSLVKVIGNRFVSSVFNVHKVIFEVDAKGSS